MLSTKGFSSSKSAQEYYSHGDYYGSEGEGMWYGMGTENLGLKGKFNAKNNKEFQAILEGYLPNGDRLGKRTLEGIEHRPGMDLTFSSPKSISIEMLVNATKAEKRKLENARTRAIKKTLDFIEKEGYVFVRKGAQGIDKERVYKLTFALFKHSTNRNNEPHDHVHCLLANMAKCSDGKYRSICWDEIFENNKKIGQYFRNFYALEIRDIGHEIRQVNLGYNNGSSFELTKIKQEKIDAFSTRTKEIKKFCEQYGVTSSKGKKAITVNSRKAKQTFEEDYLKNVWKDFSEKVEQENNQHLQQQEKTKGIIATLIERVASIFELPKSMINSEKEQKYIDTLSAKDIVDLCIKDVSNYNTVFSKDELLASACKYSIGKYSPLVLQKEINSRIAKQELIVRDNKFTVKELVEKERYVLHFAKQGLRKAKSIINKNVVQELVQHYESKTGFTLNPGQIKAVANVLTSEDKVTAINGLPGVGKSTVLDAVRSIACNKIRVIGCSPTASAAKTLEQSSGIESSTLHKFIGRYNKYIEGRGTEVGLAKERTAYKNTLLVIDESSLISTRQMYKVFKLSSKLGFRILLVGDKNQLPAVEAGKPFEQLLQIINSIELTQIMRQNNIDHRKAVIDSTRGDIESTFKIHQANIKEVRGRILSETIKQYSSLTKEERNNTIIMSPSRTLKDKINIKITESLQKDGQIRGKAVTADILKQKDMSIADRSFANSYKVGDVVQFHKTYKRAGISQGDYLTVTNINDVSNSICFSKNSKPVRFELKADINYQGKFDVFEKDKITLQEGLKIRITQNNAAHGLINSESAVIKGITKNIVDLQLNNGITKSISLKDLKHIDYGYCSTVHSVQGKTEDKTLGAITADNKYLNSQKLWTVFLSRHKNSITCIVDDSAKLKSNIQKNPGDQESALEFSNQQIKLKKSFSMKS